jgi:hypothetical protein
MPDYETKGTEMMLNNKRQKKRWAKVGFIELGWILRSYTEWKKKEWMSSQRLTTIYYTLLKVNKFLGQITMSLENKWSATTCMMNLKCFKMEGRKVLEKKILLMTD